MYSGCVVCGRVLCRRGGAEGAHVLGWLVPKCTYPGPAPLGDRRRICGSLRLSHPIMVWLAPIHGAVLAATSLKSSSCASVLVSLF